MAIITPILFALRNYKSVKSQASYQLIFNVLLSTSFFYLRYTPFICNKLPATERHRPCQLDWRESELAIFLLIFISLKNRNAISWEQSTRRAMTYSKVVSTFLFFRMHILAGILYLIVIGLRIKFFNEDSSMSLVAPEHIVYFSDEIFKETIHADHKVVWIVEAFTNYSQECTEVGPVFADLAMDYGHEFLRFGKIDVGKFDKFSKEYAISTAMMSKQLPTIMVFEGGKMVDRRPEVINKKLVNFNFSYTNIERELNLQDRFQEAKKKKGSARLPEYVCHYDGHRSKATPVAEKKTQ